MAQRIMREAAISGNYGSLLSDIDRTPDEHPLDESCRQSLARELFRYPDVILSGRPLSLHLTTYTLFPSLPHSSMLSALFHADFSSQDTNIVDNAERVDISALALLKMLRHGRAGVPMEVMGLMLGEFVDDYTVKVVDVFAMPQSGTGVSVEAVDPVFQTKMMDMLRQTGR